MGQTCRATDTAFLPLPRRQAGERCKRGDWGGVGVLVGEGWGVGERDLLGEGIGAGLGGGGALCCLLRLMLQLGVPAPPIGYQRLALLVRPPRGGLRLLQQSYQLLSLSPSCRTR